MCKFTSELPSATFSKSIFKNVLKSSFSFQPNNQNRNSFSLVKCNHRPDDSEVRIIRERQEITIMECICWKIKYLCVFLNLLPAINIVVAHGQCSGQLNIKRQIEGGLEATKQITPSKPSKTFEFFLYETQSTLPGAPPFYSVDTWSAFTVNLYFYLKRWRIFGGCDTLRNHTHNY